jgi:hypothetical protein
MLRAKFACDARHVLADGHVHVHYIMQMMRAPAARGAGNIWTPLYVSSVMIVAMKPDPALASFVHINPQSLYIVYTIQFQFIQFIKI